VCAHAFLYPYAIAYHHHVCCSHVHCFAMLIAPFALSNAYLA
jgi:hypothetical protein